MIIIDKHPLTIIVGSGEVVERLAEDISKFNCGYGVEIECVDTCVEDVVGQIYAATSTIALLKMRIGSEERIREYYTAMRMVFPWIKMLFITDGLDGDFGDIANVVDLLL